MYSLPLDRSSSKTRLVGDSIADIFWFGLVECSGTSATVTIRFPELPALNRRHPVVCGEPFQHAYDSIVDSDAWKKATRHRSELKAIVSVNTERSVWDYQTTAVLVTRASVVLVGVWAKEPQGDPSSHSEPFRQFPEEIHDGITTEGSVIR
jgi:hypothetical protein